MKPPYNFSFQLQIVTPTDHIYSEAVTQLTVRGTEGDIGINYGHAPLLTQIVPSMLTFVRKDGTQDCLYVAGGFMEVQPTNVSILADTIIRAKDIDERKAKAARDNAEKHLANCRTDELLMLELEMMQALAQLRVVKHFKK